MLDYNELEQILNQIWRSIPIRVKAVNEANGNEIEIEGMYKTKIWDQLDSINDVFERKFIIKIGMG